MMTKLEFNKDSEMEFELPAFAGFQKRANYNSKESRELTDGSLTLRLEDDRTDPFPEQIAAIEYIIENQEAIVQSIVSRTETELPEIIINYDLQEEVEYQNLDKNSIKHLIRFYTIEVKIPSKEGVSYFDVIGGCDWDDDHGLNILMHKDRTISFGGIEGNSNVDALEDSKVPEEPKAKMDPPDTAQKSDWWKFWKN